MGNRNRTIGYAIVCFFEVLDKMNYVHIASALALYASMILWIQNRLGVHGYITSDEHTKQQMVRDCVDISSEYSMCSTDPMVELGHVYSKARLNGFHIGVTQTIDGTEEEKQSIRNVLTQMNHYWKHEVLSNFEYDEVRASWYVDISLSVPDYSYFDS